MLAASPSLIKQKNPVLSLSKRMISFWQKILSPPVDQWDQTCSCKIRSVRLNRYKNYRETRQIEHFNQAGSTRCSGDNEAILSRSICREHASDFCHDRKSTFNRPSFVGMPVPSPRRVLTLRIPRGGGRAAPPRKVFLK